MLSIAYQGEPGAFSELAARKFFGRGVRLVSKEHFSEVFGFAEKRPGSYAVIPIDNSVFGSVHQNYDLLLAHSLSIHGEVTLRIRHQLLALPRVKLRDIRFIFSHPQALGQCEQFLKTLKGVKVIAHYDTAGAAKMVREEERTNAAAIASLQAAKAYRLRVLKRNIERNEHNYTRFLILSRTPRRLAKGGKTSLVFSAKDVPGALFKALAVFALRDINLLKIESRPLQGRPWEYLFYLDVLGSAREEKLTQALKHLEEVSTFVRVLGSYPLGATIAD